MTVFKIRKHQIEPKNILFVKRDVLCSHYMRLDEAFNNSLGVYNNNNRQKERRNQNGWKMHKILLQTNFEYTAVSEAREMWFQILTLTVFIFCCIRRFMPNFTTPLLYIQCIQSNFGGKNKIFSKLMRNNECVIIFMRKRRKRNWNTSKNLRKISNTFLF